VLELETAKEILSELFDMRTREVDEMIKQRMEEWTSYGQEFIVPHRSIP
jgi:CheY-specific phosphatase CheX